MLLLDLSHRDRLENIVWVAGRGGGNNFERKLAWRERFHSFIFFFFQNRQLNLTTREHDLERRLARCSIAQPCAMYKALEIRLTCLV